MYGMALHVGSDGMRCWMGALVAVICLAGAESRGVELDLGKVK